MSKQKHDIGVQKRSKGMKPDPDRRLRRKKEREERIAKRDARWLRENTDPIRRSDDTEAA